MSKLKIEMFVWWLWGVMAGGALFAYEYYSDVMPLSKTAYEILFLGWVAYVSLSIATGHWYNLVEVDND